MKKHPLVLAISFYLLWKSTVADEDQPKANKTASLTYHPFTKEHTHVRVYKVTNPVRPLYQYLGAKYAPPGDDFEKRALVFPNVPDAANYEFREFSYDNKGNIKRIVIYHDITLMKVPPIEFESGDQDGVLKANLDFQSTDVDMYMWRLYDLSGNSEAPEPIQRGTVKRPTKGGIAKAELTPIKKDKEYVLQYYAVHLIHIVTAEKPLNNSKKNDTNQGPKKNNKKPNRRQAPPNEENNLSEGDHLVLGIQMVRFYVHDSKPIIPIILFLIGLLVAIALRIYRKIHGGDGTRRTDRMLARRNRPGASLEDIGGKGSGTMSGGVRKWDAYKDLPSHPVPVEQFEGYVEGETGELEEQYNETKNIGTNASVSYAQKYPNDNRYLNIIPYNHSRVPLYPQSSGPMPKNLPPPVYINASYIPGEKNIKQYIATQGPKKDTTLAFWAMVMQTEAVVIVMLTNLKERDTAGTMRPKCTQYWPNEGTTLKLTDSFEVKNEGEETHGNGSYIVRNLNVIQMDTEVHVKQFHYKVWPDHGVPEDPKQIVEFVEDSHEHGKKSNNPVIVHCSAGVGRTGCYIILCRLKDQLANNPAEIDLQRMTSESRFCRMEMVQTAEQYKFLHVVAVYMIKKYDVKGRGAGKSEAPSQGGDGGKEKGKASDARGSSAVEEQEDGDKEPKGSEAEEKGKGREAMYSEVAEEEQKPEDEEGGEKEEEKKKSSAEEEKDEEKEEEEEPEEDTEEIKKSSEDKKQSEDAEKEGSDEKKEEEDDKDKEQDLRVSGEGPPVDVDDETSELAGEEDKGDRESKSMPESEVDGPGELRDNSASMGPPPPPDSDRFTEEDQFTSVTRAVTPGEEDLDDEPGFSKNRVDPSQVPGASGNSLPPPGRRHSTGMKKQAKHSPIGEEDENEVGYHDGKKKKRKKKKRHSSDKML